MSKVAIIGAGYVGLTTAVCFAHLGHEVICADIDPERVDRLQRGEVPIVEAGLEAMMAEGLRNGRLRFVLGAEVAAEGCEFVYLCVPDAAGRGRLGRPELHRDRGDLDRPRAHVRVDRDQQVDRAGRVDEGRREGARAVGRQRRVEPRVPA